MKHACAFAPEASASVVRSETVELDELRSSRRPLGRLSLRPSSRRVTSLSRRCRESSKRGVTESDRSRPHLLKGRSPGVATAYVRNQQSLHRCSRCRPHGHDMRATGLQITQLGYFRSRPSRRTELSAQNQGGKNMLVNADYLVVGAGSSGLAFADALVAEADVEVTVIDRRQALGGHWLDAYPFVRLHTPSAYYGVNSLALGEDRIDHVGENAGYYERATGGEVCEYFAEAARRLTRTGRIRVLTGHEHLGSGSNGERVRDLSTGELHDSRYAAKSSTPDIWRRPSRRLTLLHLMWPRAPGLSLSTTCRRPLTRPAPTSSSGPVRQPRTHASGFSITTSNQIGFAGSGPATRGSMTAPVSAAGAGRCDHGGDLPRCRGRRSGGRRL